MKARSQSEVTVEREGNTYRGTWTIARGMITVSHPVLGSKTTQVGGSDTPEAAQALAKVMLGELITEAESRASPRR